MHPLALRGFAAAALILITPLPAAAQQPRGVAPRLGFVYPAGGRAGETVEVVVGGQGLAGAASAFVTGQGVRVEVGAYDRPLTQRQVQLLRDRLDEARKRLGMAPETEAQKRPLRALADFAALAREAGLTEDEIRGLNDFRKQRADPKRQPNTQIEERVTLRVSIEPGTPTGTRELRLIANTGLSNPIRFQIGALPEYRETEPNDAVPDSPAGAALPLLLNGQILPGDTDRFAFRARRGMRLVVRADARELIPFLADAVPGWFQPVLTLLGPDGRQVAAADGFRFSQDPLLLCVTPADGEYTLEIHDTIYRGREDFVYRIAIGELPTITDIFPLGIRAGVSGAVEARGWNLTAPRIPVDTRGRAPGIVQIAAPGPIPSNAVGFEISDLPECQEREPNSTPTQAQRLRLPIVVNGRIDAPGDEDLFRFEGRARQTVALEVTARRLGSPIDSALTLTDAAGRVLAANDDAEQRGTDTATHNADSRIVAVLPHSGPYFVRIRDVQRHGGPEVAYRLRVSDAAPDFTLRVSPSALSARAGMSVPVTVTALRRDGFAGEITLALADTPPGFVLSGGRIPAGQDQVRATVTTPVRRISDPVPLRLEGAAQIAGREVRRTAVPADEMTQAFAYRHLVAASQWLALVIGRPLPAPRIAAADPGPLRIPAGGAARLRVSAPRWLLDGRTRLALSDPPAGIEITSTTVEGDSLIVNLRSDAAKAPAGSAGCLIFTAARETPAPEPAASTDSPVAPAAPPAAAARPTARPARRPSAIITPLGYLPAVTYDVVKP